MRPARIGIALLVVWLVVYVVLKSNNSVPRDVADLFGLLPVWGPLLAIAVLTAGSWIERRWKRR